MKPTATAVVRSTPPAVTPAPAAAAPTTDRITRPITSSSTAAPSTTCPSRVSSCPRSLSTRAEMPIDVALSAAAATAAASGGRPNAMAAQ
jgi:hypothetical protein